MAKTLVICEKARLAALMDRQRVVEFFVEPEGFCIGDVYIARVENILPSIDAVFVNLGLGDKMGFLHAADLPGSGPLTTRVFPKQKILVQVVKEPTGNKGPRVSTGITLIGRFFVLTTEHSNIVMSRRIASQDERARLKSIATLLKPPNGFGLVIRTEAAGASDEELEEDFRDLLLDRWRNTIDQFENARKPGLLLRDSKDLLYRVLRDIFHDGVATVAVDSPQAAERASGYLKVWSPNNTPQVDCQEPTELLKKYGVLTELEGALSSRVNLPSGGYLLIQPTEAMAVIDVNSGKFTSSSSPAETVLRTNLEASTEIARQLRLRNIGGVIVVDFIDMDNKLDRLTLLDNFEKALDTDPAHPQIGRLSDLGLVELTRHRQEKSLAESFTVNCDKCSGTGRIMNLFQDNGTGAHKHSETVKETLTLVHPARTQLQAPARLQSNPQTRLHGEAAQEGMNLSVLPEEDLLTSDEENKAPSFLSNQDLEHALVSGTAPRFSRPLGPRGSTSSTNGLAVLENKSSESEAMNEEILLEAQEQIPIAQELLPLEKKQPRAKLTPPKPLPAPPTPEPEPEPEPETPIELPTLIIESRETEVLPGVFRIDAE